MKKLIFIAVILAITGLYEAPTAYADPSIPLEWSYPYPAPDGFRIYQRTEGQEYIYEEPVWEGTELTATIPLQPATTYYWVVRAYVGNMESANSNEISFTTPEGLPPDAVLNLRFSGPVIYNNGGTVNVFPPDAGSN